MESTNHSLTILKIGVPIIIVAAGVLEIANTTRTGGTDNRTLAIMNCDKAARSYLVAPLEAKTINTAHENAANGHHKVYICYQARTRGGGYSKAGAMCQLDEKLSVSVADIKDDNSSEYCIFAEILDK